MRTLVTKTIIAAACLTLLGSATRAHAQDVMVAEVPFAFSVNGATHDAGRYEFRTWNDEHAVLLDQSGHNGTFVTVVSRMEPAGTRTLGGDGHLVFDKVGSTYYLAQMWLPDEDGFVLPAPTVSHPRELTMHEIVPLQRLASLR